MAKKSDVQGKEWPGAFEAYSTAFHRIKDNPKPLVLFGGVFAVVAIVNGLMQPGLSYSDTNYASYEDLAYLVFLLALTLYSLALADGKKLSIVEFMKFDAFKYFSLVATALLLLLVFFGSLLLLVVPIIWTVGWFLVATYAVVDKRLAPIAALKESKRISKDYKGKVWGIFGVGILISIGASFLGFIPLIGGLSTALASVWTTVAGAILFRWLQKNA
jgi:uncharacterized membrane protein